MKPRSTMLAISTSDARTFSGMCCSAKERAWATVGESLVELVGANCSLRPHPVMATAAHPTPKLRRVMPVTWLVGQFAVPKITMAKGC